MTEATPALVRVKNRRKCAVYRGSSFVAFEEDPSAISLEDLCEAFGTPWESGMHVKQRSTGRVVATLPFEQLPSLDDVSDIPMRNENKMAGDGTGGMLAPSLAEADHEDEGEDAEEELPYAVVYDLVTAAGPAEDDVDGVAAIVAAAGLTGALPNSSQGGSSIGETMRQLVELGAADLLTAEPASTVNAKREYHPPDAPGWLRRIVYPASQYSPYRVDRDPLNDGTRSLFRSAATAAAATAASASSAGPSPSCGGRTHAMTAANTGEGGSYTSYLDNYSSRNPMEFVWEMPPASGGKAAVVAPLTDEERLRIFGT